MSHHSQRPLPSASHQAVAQTGDPWRLSGLDQRCPGLKRLEQSWESRKGAGQGPVRDIWDRLNSSCGEVLSFGARTPDRLQPGTWVSSGQAAKES